MMSGTDGKIIKISSYAEAPLTGILARESEGISPRAAAKSAFQIGKAMLIQERASRKRVSINQSYLEDLELEIAKEDDDLGA